MNAINHGRAILFALCGVGITVWALTNGGPPGWPLAKSFSLGIGVLLLGAAGVARFLLASKWRGAPLLLLLGFVVIGMHLVIWPRDEVARAFGAVMACAGIWIATKAVIRVT